jgi:hypothetical protein
MERRNREGGFLIGIELTEMQWGENRAEFHARLLQAQATAPLKPMPGALNSAGNIVGLAGASISSEIPTMDQSGARRAGKSQIPGLCTLWMKDEQWRLAGLRMVWRTVTP